MTLKEALNEANERKPECQQETNVMCSVEAHSTCATAGFDTSSTDSVTQQVCNKLEMRMTLQRLHSPTW